MPQRWLKRLCGLAVVTALVATAAAQTSTTQPAPVAGAPAVTQPAHAAPPPARAADRPGATPRPAAPTHAPATPPAEPQSGKHDGHRGQLDYVAMLFVFMLSTFIGIGVIRRVSRLLHTPLMSLTNAISAIAVVGAIIVAGAEDYPLGIRILGAIAMFASMTNIISGFLITDRMLKMFKTKEGGKA